MKLDVVARVCPCTAWGGKLHWRRGEPRLQDSIRVAAIVPLFQTLHAVDGVVALVAQKIILWWQNMQMQFTLFYPLETGHLSIVSLTLLAIHGIQRAL